ncbi:TPA: tape measure protein [Escherichia coli]|uniref:tape measure protein n=3 Tax=Escherichia coli TaxID=562 RepID=UPI0007FB49A8|nr:tape measure protein [Escherichia coli]EKM2492463.1 tape measure protein [Escherichia coli O26]ELJ1122895.1 tape measure protein [Escherichia coli O168]ANP17869.1 tail tape measure protein [Escherichia coli]EET4472990.1 tape measure protein [Escherichia coli]EET5026920.1 tape measure protein [Escherichia coli]
MATSVGTIYYEVDAKTGQLLVAQRQADQAFDRIERGAKRADRQVNTLKTSIKALTRVIHLLLAAEAVRQFMDMAEQAKMLRVKIKLLTGEAEATERVFNRLKEISKETGQSLKDTGALWQGLAISLKNTSATEGQVLNLVSTLQKLGNLGGVSAEQLSNSMLQFRQAIDAGVLQAEEFNSIRDNTPTIIQEMARQMGLSMGQFRAEMLDGKITAERMLNAIQAATQETNEKFAQLPRTSGMAFNELKVEVMGLVEQLDDLFGISDGVVSAIDLITGGVEGLGKGAKFAATCFNTLKTAGSEFIDMFDDVAVKAGEVAEEIIRMVTPIKALMDGYKWMKEIIDKRKNELNSNNEKKFGPTVGKVMTFANDIKNATAVYDEFMQKQGEADDGKITGFDQPVGKPKKGKKGKKDKKSEADRLGDEGIKVSDQYNKDAAAMRKALENGKAIDAAFAQGKITLLEYRAAQKGIGKELKEELAQIPVDELRDKWAQIVSPMDQLKGEVDPIQQAQNEWAVRKQMLIDLGVTEAQQKQELLAYEQQIRDLKWEQWQAQSDTNGLIGDCVNGLKGGMSNALVGLLNGTQSLSDVFANLGSNILGNIGNRLSDIAANWIADQIMMETQSKATQASTTASAVAAQGSIAAAAAPAAAATAAATGGSWAAAGSAALTAIMSLATSIFGGGRFNGGSVIGGNMYRVGEHNRPELFQTSNGNQYMIPGENGRVIPGRDIGGGGGISMPVNINIQTTNGFSDEDSRRLEQTMERVAMKMITRESQRPGGILQPRRK